MRRARWALATLVGLGSVLGLASSAAAHPLGNFTVNTYAGVIVRPSEVLVDAVLDLAEIPAFRERRAIDRNGDGDLGPEELAAYRAAACDRLAADVVVTVDGERVPLAPLSKARLSFPPGVGGLPTLRLECPLRGALASPLEGAAATVRVDNGAYAGRIGWHEITLVGDGVELTGADAPSSSVSDRLRAYPPDALPLDVRRASASAIPGGSRLAALPWERSSAPVVRADGGLLGRLAARPTLSPGLIGATILVAIGLGAVHALGPGHGKTLIGAHLVGAGGSLRGAVVVGTAVAGMHTASVLGLGLVVWSAERVVDPERIYPWVGIVAGLTALALGCALLVGRVRASGRTDGRGAHPHDHAHPHGTGEDDGAVGHGHPHGLGRRGIVALAVSGGALPSPSALVVLLASMSLGRTALGLAAIAAFSVGLAATLIAVGTLALRARAAAERRFAWATGRLVPIGSAAVIALVGLALALRGVAQL